MEDLQNRLQYYAAGTTVTLKIKRQTGEDYAEKEFTVVLGKGANASKDADSNAAEEGQYDGSKKPAPGQKNPDQKNEGDN